MQTSTISARITSANARVDKCKDRRTSDELQRAVLNAGERLIRVIPDHNIIEPALDEATGNFVTGTADQRLAGVAKLAGLFLDSTPSDTPASTTSNSAPAALSWRATIQPKAPATTSST